MLNNVTIDRILRFSTAVELFAGAGERIADGARWACWKREWDYSGETAKAKKPPIDAKEDSGQYAKANDPETWATVQTAIKAAIQKKYEGVSFIPDGSGIVCIDLDDCSRGTTEGIKNCFTDGAQRIVTAFDTYTEISPSGRGLHIFCYAAGIPQINTVKDYAGQKLEIWNHGKFCTVTGRTLPGREEIKDCTRQMIKLLEYYRKKEAPATQRTAPDSSFRAGDAAVLDKMFRGKYGEEAQRLYDGDTAAANGDHSRADFMLCKQLAYWSSCDPAQIDRLFRGSGLMRDKWDKVHTGRNGRQTYGQMTIDEAISAVQASGTLPREYTAEEKREYGRKQAEAENALRFNAID